MAQATSDQCREFWYLPQSAPHEAHTILAAETIYQMSLAMLVAGKVRAYVSGTVGSSMLGLSKSSYTAPALADLVLEADKPALFLRGVFACAGKAGDLPTEALIGKAVYFDDSSGTVKATMAANDLSGTLRAIKDGFYWVEV